MDVVNAVNDFNLILPAGDVKMGPFDYYVYSNSLVNDMDQLGQVPVKTVGNSWVSVNDVGRGEGCQPDPVQPGTRRWPDGQCTCRS